MKRRTIKKSLQYVMDDMLTATLLTLTNPGTDTEQVADLQTRIIRVYQDYNARLSHYERRNARPFFRQWREGINKELTSIVDDIEKL